MHKIKKLLYIGDFNPKHNSLNFIRLVLAVVVIISHSFAIAGYGPEPGVLGLSLGGWAVLAFFGISGYLIAASRDHSRFRDFIIKRFVRIFPAYLICILVIAFIIAPIGYAIAHTGDFAGYFSQPKAILSFIINNFNLALSANQAVVEPTTLAGLPHPSYIGSIWTLSYELFCYLIVGILFSLIPNRKVLKCSLISIFIISIIFFVLVGNNTSDMHNIASTVRLLGYFSAGSLLYFFLQKSKLEWKDCYISIVSLVALLLIGKFYLPGYTIALGIAMSLFITHILLYLSTALPLGRLGKFTREHDISYGVYIYAFAIQNILALFAVYNGFRPSVFIYILLSIALTCVFAIPSWLFIEKPALERLRSAK
jgi:peptidoglycan/LPS O-acetylase OafA/YrhL